MDIKKMAEELIGKIKNDPAMMDKFMKEPVPTVEKLIGIDLPDDQINKIVDLVKAKIGFDKASTLLGGIGSLLKK